MGTIGIHRPVMLIAAVTSQYEKAFDWGIQKSESAWGKIGHSSDRFEFTETSYYEKSMGDQLRKQFWVYDKLVDPNSLPAAKWLSNEWEDEFRAANQYPVDRPINIDPGYISEAKLVLATTKDRDHRIYLDQGIYAEVTLHFHRGQWQSRPWTYPDYQRTDFQSFFTACRTDLRKRYKEMSRAEISDEDFQ